MATEPSSVRRVVRLGDVADVNWGDTTLTKASYVDDGFPAYSATGPDGFLPDAQFRHTGVVVSAIGAQCGRTWLARGEWSTIKNTLRFWSTDPEVDTEYLYWATRDPRIWPKRGSAQPFISQGDARAMRLALPPLGEQRRIAHILGTLDDKIELNRRMNQTLEEMARALFKSWFVDFDPVRAKADGRDPGLPHHLADLFPDRLVDSPLGPIPGGWEIVDLGDLLDLAYGRALKADERRDGSVQVFGSNGPIGSHHVPLVDSPGIIVGRKGTPGVVWWSAGPFWPIDTTFYVQSRLPDQGLPYLFHVLRHQRLAHLSADSAVPGLNRNAVYALKEILPPQRLREEFEGTCVSLQARADVSSAEGNSVSRLRDALLPALLRSRFNAPPRAASVRAEVGLG